MHINQYLVIYYILFWVVRTNGCCRRGRQPLLRGSEWFFNVHVQPDFYIGAGRKILHRFWMRMFMPLQSTSAGYRHFALRPPPTFKLAVAPQNTSRKCPECGHVSRENRKSQAKFVCGGCGFSAHADFVGAVNIKEAGLASLACSWSSGEVSPSWQEPTEGIPAPAWNQ